MCCHFLLDTGKCVDRNDKRCRSKKKGKQVKKLDPFNIPAAQRGT